MRIIKYTSSLPAEIDTVCAEERCEEKATLHVCFEDGTGTSVCEKCFEVHVNDCSWITDSAQHLLAS